MTGGARTPRQRERRVKGRAASPSLGDTTALHILFPRQLTPMSASSQMLIKITPECFSPPPPQSDNPAPCAQALIEAEEDLSSKTESSFAFCYLFTPRGLLIPKPWPLPSGARASAYQLTVLENQNDSPLESSPPSLLLFPTGSPTEQDVQEGQPGEGSRKSRRLEIGWNFQFPSTSWVALNKVLDMLMILL